MDRENLCLCKAHSGYTHTCDVSNVLGMDLRVAFSFLVMRAHTIYRLSGFPRGGGSVIPGGQACVVTAAVWIAFLLARELPPCFCWPAFALF